MVPFVKMLREVLSSRGHFKKSFDEIVGISGGEGGGGWMQKL